MIQQIKSQWYKVRIYDLIKTKLKNDTSKFKIGWYGPFPPLKTGAAAISYWFIKELSKHDDIAVYAIPFGRVIDKNLFPKIKLTTPFDKNLDCIIIFGLGTNLKLKPAVKSLAYQTIHFPFKESKREQAVLTNLTKYADRILAVTKWGRKQYKSQGIKNVKYLPHGVDIKLFQPKISQEKSFKVIFVSRLVPDKGIMPFLESIPLVLKMDKNIIFDIYGYIDYEHPKLKGRIYGNYNTFYRKQKDIEAKIDEIKKRFPNNFFHYPAWRSYETVPQIYEGSHLLVFPSNNEGFGIPMIEAMACGLPVITLNKPPMNEIVINNKTGFCLSLDPESKLKYGMEFPSPHKIAGKIILLKSKRKQYLYFSKNARKHIEKNYSLNKCATNLIEICKK